MKAKTSALHEESQKGQNKVMDYKLHLQQKTSQLEETRRREREVREKQQEEIGRRERSEWVVGREVRKNTKQQE